MQSVLALVHLAFVHYLESVIRNASGTAAALWRVRFSFCAHRAPAFTSRTNVILISQAHQPKARLNSVGHLPNVRYGRFRRVECGGRLFFLCYARGKRGVGVVLWRLSHAGLTFPDAPLFFPQSVPRGTTWIASPTAGAACSDRNCSSEFPAHRPSSTSAAFRSSDNTG